MTTDRETLTLLILGRTAPMAADAIIAAGWVRAETTGFVAPVNDKRPARSTGEWAEHWQGLKRGPTTTAATNTEKP